MMAYYRLGMLAKFPDLRRRDLDNVVKAVKDALEGLLWADDCQVHEIYAARALDRKEPGLRLVVSIRDEWSSPDSIHTRSLSNTSRPGGPGS